MSLPAAASGEVLLFLHADTKLPCGFDCLVRGAFDRPGVIAGTFKFAIAAPPIAFPLIEILTNLRTRLLQLPYGDQAILVSAAAFRRCGGLPEQDIMEDCELMRRLRRWGRIAVLPAGSRSDLRRTLDGTRLVEKDPAESTDHCCISRRCPDTNPGKMVRT